MNFAGYFQNNEISSNDNIQSNINSLCIFISVKLAIFLYLKLFHLTYQHFYLRKALSYVLFILLVKRFSSYFSSVNHKYHF